MQVYHLNPDQQEVLKQRMMQVSAVLLNTDFSAPEQDARMIRHHAYQKGKFDLLKEMLEDDFPETDYTQTEG